ncbi:MAG: quinoprotein glucose dehydrogenase, partial [Acidobacteriaceae bacterium]|nr:quinoprotein glucose dehydrogenase [Acidobacteriaceae bacterium]
GVGAALASDSLAVFSLSGSESVDSLSHSIAKPENAAPAANNVTAAPSGQNHLPPGPGHDVMVRVCSGCHSPEIAANQHLSAQEWNSLVQNMSARGAVATDAEFDQITDYLVRSFPRTLPPPQ